MTENNTEKKNRAVLVGLSSRALAPEENADEASMEELSALLETAGGECVGVVTQSKDSPDPRTFIGRGQGGRGERAGPRHERGHGHL